MQLSLSDVMICARRIDASRAACSDPYPLILTSQFPALSRMVVSHDGRLGAEVLRARKVRSGFG